jgi:hypothetical protein
MTGAARPPTASAGASPASPRRRRAVKIASAFLIAAVAAWGIFTWLFFDPFEGRVASLDRVIPSSVGFAIRGSLAEILGAPLVEERILARPEVADLLRSWNVEDLLRRVADEQERINARLPGFVGTFDFRADLLGSETAVFGTMPSGLVVATRLSGKARMGFSLLKHEWARRRVETEGGLRVTRFPLIYEIDASGQTEDPRWATVWAALVRDVLIVGNDRSLVQDAAHLAASGGRGSLPDRPDAGTAFSAQTPAPLRGWIDLGSFGTARTTVDSLEGPAGFMAMLLDPDAVATAQAVVRFPSGDEALLEVSGVRGDAAAGLSAALAEGRPRPAAELLKEAALLAPAGSAAVVARIEARAGALLKAAYGRFEAPIREEIEKSLAAEKATFDDVCRDVDDYLEPGVSVVVERLPECDALPLDVYGADAEGRYVLPVPGVLLVLRQKSSAGEGSAERFFRRWMEKWKEQLEHCEDLKDLPAGMTGFRFRPKFLTGDKALWQPAAAFEGDLVLLSLNEGTLRRALEARAGTRPAITDFEGFAAAVEKCGEGQVAAFVEMGAALKLRRDERREWATRRVEKDWVKERKRITAQVIGQMAKQIVMKELEEEVDRRVEEEVRVQKEIEFPRALEEFARGVQAFEDLRSVAAGVWWDTAGFRLTTVVGAGR